MKKTLILDGNNFSNRAEFYDEIEKVFTKGLDWKIGRNLNALNDILRGGFGVTAYEEPFKLIWKHSEKSKTDLGYPQTIAYLEELLESCHPSNRELVQQELDFALRQQGRTFFERVLDMIKNHEMQHIELNLEA